VLYEEFEKDPAAIACRILEFLQVEMSPARRLAARSRGLADDLNKEWKARYLSDSEQGAPRATRP
jgi:LPS sulfotransferase NodH